MSVNEIIERARIVIEGDRVQLDRSVWEEILTLLEDLEDARWDALFADDRSEQLLAQMVSETVADIEAGRVEQVGIGPDDNSLVPG